jgi:serine/threonine protein kinase
LELVNNRYLLVDGERPRGGGSAVVRKATDISSHEPVAVKFVSGASDAIVRKLHDREVAMLKRSKHPNIVRYVDSGIDEAETPFVVLEWVEKTVTDLLAETEPIDWKDFINQILRPLADAIAYLHHQSIEHRDVKPGNVLLNEAGSPILADFGISKIKRADDDTSMTLADFFSPLYSPPERVTEVAYVRDVYSLGVLFIQAATTPAHRATEHHELQAALERLSLPAEIFTLFLSAIDVVPKNRPANAIDFLRRLDRAMESIGPKPSKASVYIGLTIGARSQIVGPEGFSDRAESLLAEDLGGEVHASFRWDAETLAHDKSILFVFGSSFRLTLKLDSTRGNFIVTGAKKLEYDDLERGRNRSLQVDSFVTWIMRRSLDPLGMARAQDLLCDRVQEFHEEDERSSLGEDAANSSLLNGWRRTLAAREALATGELSEIEFDGVKSRGKESEFGLLEVQEIDRLGSEWQLMDRTGKPRARGSVVHQSEKSLTIRWQWGQGPKGNAQGQLSPYLGPSQTAIDRQRDALRRIESGLSARPNLLAIVANPAEAVPPIPANIVSWLSDIDESKKKAVAAAVGLEDCMIVTGPPGTGKTRFIGETVAQVLANNPNARILIVSQTHVAIDNALERLIESGVEDVVRIGRSDDERISSVVKPWLLDVQLRKWAQGTRERAENYLEQRALAAGIKQKHLRAVMHLEEFISIAKNRAYLESRLPDLEAHRDQTASRAGNAEDPVEFQKKIEDAGERMQEILDDVKDLLGDDLNFSSFVSVREVEDAVELLISQSDQAGDLLKLLKLQADWLQRISSDDRLAATFLESSRVIAGTCLGFISHRAVRELTFDLCIVDEASKATSTELLVPLVRSEKFILVGDSNQLPPLDEEMLQNEQILQDHDLTADFVRETLFEKLALTLPAASRFALTEQYRMIAPIGRLISTCFYEGELESPNTVGVRGYEHIAKPVLWLDTSKSSRRRENRDSKTSASYLNRLEADKVFEQIVLLNSSIERGLVKSRSDGRPYEVLIIAPYRSQLDELTRRLTRLDRAPRHLTIEIESVDAVQGREADFTFFSVTRSNSNANLGFLGDRHWRRINVALSRSRFGLTIVGDAEFCGAQPGGLQRVLSYMASNQADCEMRDVDVSNGF